ncbi:unnamed protein product [Ilex paraguariensis]
MDGQSHQNALKSTSSALGKNTSDVCHFSEEDLNRHSIMEAEMSGILHVPMLLPEWIHYQQPARNYVEFLAENGVSGIKREVSYDNSGMMSGFKPPNSSLDMDEQKVRYLRPHGEESPMNSFTSAEHQIHVQEQESNGECHNVSQPQLSIAAAAPSFQPKFRNSAARQRATSADRRRRLRIAQRLDALQELLPQNKEGSKASLLDDVIDYIKYLQLQIKDLSRSRLGGESTLHPFIFLEGYGHYLIHDQMLNEPLEEMMGKLVEVNPSAAAQLLESRGIFMMPMALAEGLNQSI